MTNRQSYSNQVTKCPSKITVLVCLWMRCGSSSENFL